MMGDLRIVHFFMGWLRNPGTCDALKSFSDSACVNFQIRYIPVGTARGSIDLGHFQPFDRSRLLPMDGLTGDKTYRDSGRVTQGRGPVACNYVVSDDSL
jgi:hypothetical protein